MKSTPGLLDRSEAFCKKMTIPVNIGLAATYAVTQTAGIYNLPIIDHATSIIFGTCIGTSVGLPASYVSRRLCERSHDVFARGLMKFAGATALLGSATSQAYLEGFGPSYLGVHDPVDAISGVAATVSGLLWAGIRDYRHADSGIVGRV